MDSTPTPVGGVPDSGQAPDDTKPTDNQTPAPSTDVQAANSSPSANAHVTEVMGGSPAIPAKASEVPPPVSGQSSQPAQPPSPIVQPPAIADDNDLIEPEWVDGAKAIVERTHDDPYMQNKEISKLKADYMLKRYKKSIKVVEE